MNVFRCLVVMVLVACGTLHAQVTLPDIETLVAAQKDKVQAILYQQQRGLASDCAKLAVLMPSAISVFEPLEMASGAPAKGRWQVRYAVDACGVAQMRNVAMQVVNGNVALEALVPGDTLTDTQLQADVVRSFAMAGRVAMPKCNEMPVVRETRVQILPKGANDPWQELWIGRMCGRDLGQMVKFVPGKAGTTFRMSLPKAAKAVK